MDAPTAVKISEMADEISRISESSFFINSGKNVVSFNMPIKFNDNVVNELNKAVKPVMDNHVKALISGIKKLMS